MSRILVVDDDANILDLVRHRLTSAGHRVATAADGAAALNIIAERGLPELAVLDVSMPGMTGLELAGRIRAVPDGAEVPIIFLSARVQPQDIAAGQAHDALYLTKPFIASTLLAAVERLTATPTSW